MLPAKNTPHEWSEDKLQGELYLWFHNTFPALRGLLFAVPNGGSRDGLQAKILKATGVFPGVSDMIFLWDRNAYLIELKRPDGKGYSSPNQVKWGDTVKAQGFVYVVFNDLVEVQTFILEKITADKSDKDNYPHKQLDLFSCHHYFIQKDAYWKSCIHCGMIEPLNN